MKTNTNYKIMGCCLTIILFIGFSLWGKSQAYVQKPSKKSDIPTKLSVKCMQSDLNLLWSVIQKMHPGYGYYTSSDSLQKAYDRVSLSIVKPLYESEFISQIYPFICQLRCGHTQLKHSVGYKQPIGLYPAHLPFKVLVSKGRVFVTSHQTDLLTTGDEIIGINGVAAEKIIAHGFDLYAMDGYNETFKELFLSEYDGFQDVCNAYYHWKGDYRIQLQTAQGIRKDVVVETKDLDFEDITTPGFDNYKNWTLAQHTGNLVLRFSADSATALFETKPFSYGDTAVYEEVFKQIKGRGVKHLILDMRHNTGGDIRVAIRLLSYLADAPFSIVTAVKSRFPGAAIHTAATYFDTERTNNLLLGYKITDKEGGWYHVESTAALGKIYGPLPLTADDHFDGNLYVLIDGATFSSGALFTAALKSQRKNVTFIGRETAGNEEGCNGMVMQALTLPSTKVVVDFPLMRVESVALNPIRGRGVMPDYPVNYDPMDIVIKRDRDLEKALQLSQGN
ncbi:MAG: hypothetical protein LBJ04_21615 [Sphingobacterium sp.]|nr:hypothetical protein [Sphingobacterium sp.]